ncbi:hypothetical protein EVAR_41227_1 [Eumeta japonica]|uniref:Mos1 transposase HTH domain-containing protein n=1 Tax=Eumeta variegata TaxID=151549 RepID=A0A4C1W335_EUMVA|nr:hypothetical protein EVAR_41227_1 [Eumeta japonica]
MKNFKIASSSDFKFTVELNLTSMAISLSAAAEAFAECLSESLVTAQARAARPPRYGQRVCIESVIQQNLARLQSAFGEEAPSKTTICKWFSEFKRGRVNLSNGFLHGRPSTAMNNKNIDAVRRMIKSDKRVTYHKIWASLCIGMI